MRQEMESVYWLPLQHYQLLDFGDIVPYIGQEVGEDVSMHGQVASVQYHLNECM